MTFREIVELGVIGLGIKIGDKLIKDNLPNLHYKNVIKGFEKYVLPILFVLILLGFYGFALVTKNHEAKKNILLGLCVFTVALGIMHFMEKRQSETKSLQAH